MAALPWSNLKPEPTESSAQSYERMRQRELALSRLLIFYIVSGLLFMLLPGTFLGVWNLIAISGRRASESVSPAWIQAHGHAQVLGWIGSFILGIGYYSIPKLRRGARPFALATAWVTAGLWMAGVLLRWLSNVYLWHWRVLLPLSGAMELAAFLIFFRAVSQHKPQARSSNERAQLDPWIFVVITGATGLLLTLVLNLGAGIWLAVKGSSPAFPQAFDQRFLVLAAWGFMVPFVWGFSAKWVSTFLGTRIPWNRGLAVATGVLVGGVIFGLSGWFLLSMLAVFAAAWLAVAALGIFSPCVKPAKTQGVHASFPYFLRAAYIWLLIAGGLGIWAAMAPNPYGIWGASRHALTVGFVSSMVFCVGQRILPAFSGMRVLYSPKLMFAGLLLLTVGCTLRVSGEVLAYQEILPRAWSWLPYSAVLELSAVTLFAVNLVVTFLHKPAVQARLTYIQRQQPAESLK
jgi:uncharacterized protein involved in response to NO